MSQEDPWPETPADKQLVARIKLLVDSENRGDRLDFSSLSPEQTEKLIAAVKRARSFSSGAGVSREGAEPVLIALGDEETIRSKVEENMPIGWPIDSAIEKYAPPVAIPIVAERLFDDGKVGRVPGGDHPAYFPSTAAARLALCVLGNSPSFDASVINWARALYDWETILPPTDSKEEARRRYAQQRDIMREWWRENQQFFAQKNYKAVQPGNDLRPISENGATADVPAASASSTLTPVGPAPVGSAAQSSTPSGAFLWTAAALAVALLAGLLFFWKRRA